MRRAFRPTKRAGHQEASARLSAALAAMPYPISRDQLADALGDLPISLKPGLDVAAGRIIAALPERDFEEPGAAARAVDRHWGDVTRSILEGSPRGR
jgi:hypothetical protein